MPMNIYRRFRYTFFLAFIAILIFCSDLYAQPAGGKWTAMPLLPVLSKGHMVFADSLVGYYIGVDTGYVTKTGGLTWTAMTFPPNARPAPDFLFAPDHNTIMSFQKNTLDSNGVQFPGVIMSSDMGATWSLISNEVIPQFTEALTMWTAKDGFRIWLDSKTLMDTCAITHDGGKTFGDIRGDATLEKYISKLSNGSNNGNLSIQSNWSDALHGVIAVASKDAGAFPILLTSDGGHTWTEHYMKYNGDSTLRLSTAYLYGSQSVWVTPSSTQTPPREGYFLYYSPDFGATWKTTDTLKSQFFIKLAPVSATASWAAVVGANRNIASTSNLIDYKDISGPWNNVYTVRPATGFYSLTIKDIQFIDSTHGWVLAIFVVGLGSTDDQYAHIFRFATTAPDAVSSVTENTHLRCVPNPASENVRIDGLSNGEIVKEVKLINTLGKQCSYLMGSTGTAIELDVRDQPNGCYFLTITTSLRTENIPVMVMH